MDTEESGCECGIESEHVDSRHAEGFVPQASTRASGGVHTDANTTEVHYFADPLHPSMTTKEKVDLT
jgi:hypothetical protein